MNRLRLVVVLLALALVLVGRWTARTSAAAIPVEPRWEATLVADPGSDFLQDDRAADVVEPRMDVLGNEVDDAIGDYRVDTKGDIYERHSPETEVTRLRPPVM